MVFIVAMGFHLYAFHHADTSRQTGTLAIVIQSARTYNKTNGYYALMYLRDEKHSYK